MCLPIITAWSPVTPCDYYGTHMLVDQQVCCHAYQWKSQYSNSTAVTLLSMQHSSAQCTQGMCSVWNSGLVFIAKPFTSKHLLHTGNILPIHAGTEQLCDTSLSTSELLLYMYIVHLTTYISSLNLILILPWWVESQKHMHGCHCVYNIFDISLQF